MEFKEAANEIRRYLEMGDKKEIHARFGVTRNTLNTALECERWEDLTGKKRKAIEAALIIVSENKQHLEQLREKAEMI